MKEKSVRIFLFILGLIAASVFAAALPARATTRQSDAELLQSAAQEFSAMIKPYVVTLPEDTFFFHWTHAVLKSQDQLKKYVDDVTSNYGKPSTTDDWEGPGLYLAQDETSSLTFGNNVVILKIRKGSTLLYINAKGATPFVFDKDSKIREWLSREGQAAGTPPDFSKEMTPHWLSDAPGGGDLVRAAGVVGYLYDWNVAHAPMDCAQMTAQALDLITSSAVVDSKVVAQDPFFQTPYAQLKAKGDQDVAFMHILDLDTDDYEGTGTWKSILSSQEQQDYVDWKRAHLLFCQRPYLSKLFPDTVQRQ